MNGWVSVVLQRMNPRILERISNVRFTLEPVACLSLPSKFASRGYNMRICLNDQSELTNETC